ncbi:unnamed protein product, partial [Adineta steineri]
QQLRLTRSTSSALIEQYINDCRTVGDTLQVNVQRINDDIGTMLSTCSRSVGQILSITTNISQQMYILNEKVRGVLSLAFQNFHTIFEELNTIYNQFQTELDHELRVLIDMLAVEIKNDENQCEKNIEEEILIKIKTCFQEMLISFKPTQQSLWDDLHTFFTQRFS